MIYIKTAQGQHVLIIEPDNIERLKGNEPLASPNGEVTVAFTPDIDWFRDELLRIAQVREIMPVDVEDLLDRGSIRPEVKGRNNHPLIKIIPGDKIHDA